MSTQVKFLRAWNGYAVDDVAYIDDATATALVANYTASLTTAGGVPYDPNAAFTGLQTQAVSRANAQRAGYLTRNPKSMLFGDSMVQREWLTTLSAAGVTTEASKVGYGWLNHANVILGQPFDVIYNDAYTGYTTSQMLALMDTALAHAAECGYVFISAGTNDVYASLDTPANIIPRLKTIFSRFLEVGCVVVWENLTPRSFIDATKVAYVLEINAYFATWKQGNPNFIYFDAGAALANSTSTQYAAATNVLISGSAVHLSNLGAYTAGYAFSQLMSGRVLPTSNLPMSAADTSTISALSNQLFSNPLMTGTGGTFAATGGGTAAVPTGTAPDGVQVDNVVSNNVGDCVVSVAARTVANDGDTIGNNVVLTIGGVTPAIANGRWTVRNIGNITTNVQPGDWLQLEGSVRVSAQNNLAALPLFIQTQVDGGTVCVAHDLRNDAANITYPSGFVGGKYKTRPFQLPEGTTLNALQWRVEPRFVTAGGTATIHIGRIALRNLSRMGIM